MTGLSVIVRNEQEYNKLRDFLGRELKFNWTEKMSEVETAAVIYCLNLDFITGDICSSIFLRECDFITVEFSEWFK